MRKITKSILLLTSAVCLSSSQLSAVTTDVVGYTSTTLPGGAGNLFAPAFVNSDVFVGSLNGINPGSTSTLTLSQAVDAGEFDAFPNNPGVSKGYPAYYVEVLNDTDASDGLDTEGLVIDIASNTATQLIVAQNVSALGLKGDESIAIRKHLTLTDIFAGSTGLGSFEPGLTIYNEDGAGTVVDHLPDGSGGFVLASDFVTDTSNAPIHPGTGFVITNSAPVTIVPSGKVKETDTQVSVFANSVNIVGTLKPLESFDFASDGRLSEALDDFNDAATIYATDGSLAGVVDFLDDGTGGFVQTDFVTPTSVLVDGTYQPIVVAPLTNTVYKTTGNTISQ